MAVPEPSTWLEFAEAELRRALERFRVRDYSYTCYHAEQATQMALKAVLIAYGNFLPTHDLTKLAKRVSRYGVVLQVPLELLEWLTLHYYASRYPDARVRTGVRYELPVAEFAIYLAQYVLKQVRRVLHL